MGELWRSEEMQLVQLYVQIEAAHDTVDALGELGLIQFRDLNPHVTAFQRNFVNEVKRADEMERKLRFFEKQLKTANQEAADNSQPEIKVDDTLTLSKPITMDDLEDKFDDLEKELIEMNTHQDALHRNFNQLIELKYVLEKGDTFFSQAKQSASLLDDDSVGTSLLDAEEGTGGTGANLRGVIDRSSFIIFERILFRATRGNLFMRYSEIDDLVRDPHTGELIPKNVFIIFFQGARFESKIKKICESFSANIYPCPDTSASRQGLLDQALTRLDDLKLLLDRGAQKRSAVLSNIADELVAWKYQVAREKAIYHTMNKFNYDLGRKCLIAEGWCPTSAMESVQLALRSAREKSGALVPSILNVIPAREEPPTYFNTNKFTSSFQEIVNAYGVARYREVNPAVLTMVTFPFQFGVMFGDVGHGFLLLLFALLLVFMERYWKEGGRKLPTDMLEIPYSGRYVLVLMSLFAIYCGALYNECFSIPMNFGSAWSLQTGPDLPNNTFVTIVDPAERWHYAFGVDPVWKGATNELLYYNSLKMKTSILIGVTQMVLGLFLKLLNGIHFRHELDILFEFLPQLVFLLSIFGYLCFMICYKWGVDYMWQDHLNAKSHGDNLTWTPTKVSEMGTSEVPMLLNQLIFMFMPNPDKTALPLFEGQEVVNKVLLILALISVPTMMFAKPVVLWWRNKNKKAYVVNNSDSSQEDEVAAGGHGGHGGEFSFGEAMIHQALETVEFVLGSVSHTASYLRLWALSLAHSELATVFYEKMFAQLFDLTAGVGIPVATAAAGIVGFSAWFAATLVVLLFMESLSAFLHALRLHWVEFQSKFYDGDGYRFEPFTYKTIDVGYGIEEETTA